MWATALCNIHTVVEIAIKQSLFECQRFLWFVCGAKSARRDQSPRRQKQRSFAVEIPARIGEKIDIFGLSRT